MYGSISGFVKFDKKALFCQKIVILKQECVF